MNPYSRDLGLGNEPSTSTRLQQSKVGGMVCVRCSDSNGPPGVVRQQTTGSALTMVHAMPLPLVLRLHGRVRTCTTTKGLGMGPKTNREDSFMKATVNEECIGCGMCEGICPDVFSINDDGVAEAVEEIEEEFEDAVQEAADSCPAGAIEVE